MNVSLARAVASGLMLMSLSGCAAVEYQKRWHDRDRDGIANNEDRCPSTESGALVNQQGCNLFQGVLEGVTFETNGAELNTASRRALDPLIEGLKSRPGTIIGVHAHTDNRGKAVKNLELSKQRVMQVVRYLVDEGVSGDQLRPYGYGESRPRVSNATAEGRQANRRIEVVLVEQGTLTELAALPE